MTEKSALDKSSEFPTEVDNNICNFMGAF